MFCVLAADGSVRSLFFFYLLFSGMDIMRKSSSVTSGAFGKGCVCILTACIIWGYGYTVIKNAQETLNADTLMTLRYIPAAIVMLLIFLPQIKKALLPENRRYTISGCTMTGILLYCSQYCQTKALSFSDVSAGQVSFITALYVLIVPFLHSLIARRLPARNDILCAVTAAAGLFLLVNGNSLSGFHIGCLIALAGSVLFAVHILVISHFTQKTDPSVLTAGQFITAAVVSAVVQAVHHTPLFGRTPDVGTIAGILYLGFASTMIGFYLQILGQKYLSPETSSVLLSTESVFGMIFSVMILQEKVTIWKLAGCLLMLIAVICASFIGQKKTTDRMEQKKIVSDL